MLSTSIDIFLFAVLVIFAFPYFAWRLLRKPLWAPLVVVQIVGGILMGPSLLGKTIPEAYGYIFDTGVVIALNGVSSLAVVMFIWVVGIDLDVGAAWRKRREIGTVAILALVFPLILGSIAAAILEGYYDLTAPSAKQWQSVLAIGMTCAVTSLPILVVLLENMRILHTEFGQRILLYASIDDLAIWILLAIVVLDWNRLLLQVGFVVLFIPTAILVRRLFVLLAEDDRWTCGLIWVTACSLAAEWAGLHYTVGAFLSGAIIKSSLLGTEKVHSFRNAIQLTMMPIFFVTTGLRTSWDAGGFNIFLISGVLLLVSVVGKLIGVRIAGRLLQWHKHEAQVVGWLLQTKGLMVIIFGNILLDKLIITQTMFTSVILVATLSTMMTMPLVRPLLKHHHL